MRIACVTMGVSVLVVTGGCQSPSSMPPPPPPPALSSSFGAQTGSKYEGEPHMVVTSGGDLIVSIWQGLKPGRTIGYTLSRDHGETWSPTLTIAIPGRSMAD